MSAAGVIAALRERGLIASDAPPAPDEPDRPWFLSLLMGLAGWVAGLFVLVFLALALDLDKTTEVCVAGLVLLSAAWVLYYVGRGRVFVDQLALALSIAGQLAVTVYLFEKLHGALPVAAAILALQLVLFVAMPDRTARVLAALFAGIAWVYVARFALRPIEGGGVIFDGDFRFAQPAFGVWTLPVEWLLTWLPAIAIVTWLRRTETRWIARAAAAYARPALTGLLLALAVGGIGAEPVSMLAPAGDAVGRDFDGWALFPLLSIGLALFAAYSAFALRSAGLTGIAICAALVHLARFYQLYGTTLTMKSALMLGAGLLLLGAGRLVARRAQVHA